MSKSEFKRLSITTNIKTQAGLEMFKYFNDNYGSSIWGPALKGIQAIEEEIISRLVQAWQKTDNPDNLTYADGLADAVSIARGDK